MRKQGKSWRIIVVILIILIALILMYGYARSFLQKKQCCYECTNAFSQSPVAVGREAAECGKFGSAQPITSDCGDYFRQHPSSVAGCALKIRE